MSRRVHHPVREDIICTPIDGYTLKEKVDYRHRSKVKKGSMQEKLAKRLTFQ